MLPVSEQQLNISGDAARGGDDEVDGSTPGSTPGSSSEGRPGPTVAIVAGAAVGGVVAW